MPDNKNFVQTSILQGIGNLPVEKMTLSTALGFEPRSFDKNFKLN